MTDHPPIDEQTHAERARLVRLCARITGDPHAAEDLAQETLVTAWRKDQKLRDAAGRDRWLAAIARNVCRRWARSHARQLAHGADAGNLDLVPDTAILGDELERRELVAVLQHALALLPPLTRTALIARYVDRAPHAVIAAHLGVSQDAVAMRLTRGKHHLRRVLVTDFASVATAYGFVDEASAAWHPTQLWCPACGAQRLVAQLPPLPEPLAFRCPACSPDAARPDFVYQRTNAHFARLLGERTRPPWVFKRVAGWAHAYFRRALDRRSADCTHCGRPVALAEMADLSAIAPVHDPHFVYVHCKACGTAVSTSYSDLLLNEPAVQHFWWTERRIRRFPDYTIDRNGQPALVSRFQSLTSPAQLAVVSAGATFNVVEVDSASPRAAS